MKKVNSKKASELINNIAIPVSAVCSIEMAQLVVGAMINAACGDESAEDKISILLDGFYAQTGRTLGCSWRPDWMQLRESDGNHSYEIVPLTDICE